MQSEESTSSAETLENLQYANQHQSNSVLDPSVIEEQSEAFDSTAMGGHGQELKRTADVLSDDSDDSSPGLDLPKKKKTKGRVKIEMKFIGNKLRRYTTFSKRKTGIMKKVCRSIACIKTHLVSSICTVEKNIKLMFFFVLFSGIRIKYSHRNTSDVIGSF